MKKISIFSMISGILLSFSVQAQMFSEYVEDKKMRNLKEIEAAFERDIVDLDEETRNKRKKHFYRKIRAYEGNLDKNGNIINFTTRNWKAFQEAKRIFRSTSRSTHGDWELISPPDFNLNYPTSGRAIRAIGHPTNTFTVFMGSPDGGLWKTTNNGNSWANLMPGFINLGVSGIAIHHTNPDIIYVLTGDGDGRMSPCSGIFKTENGGMDWQPTGFMIDESIAVFGRQLRMHPTNPNIMVAATDFGILRTTDGWENVDTVATGNFYDIEFDTDNPNTLYAGTAGQFFRSVDGGLTFLPITQIENITPDDNSVRMAIAVMDAQPSLVYVVMVWDSAPSGGTNGHYELYKSTNNGSTFQLVSEGDGLLGTQSYSNLVLEIDPDNANNIFLGGVNLNKSTNGGLTFSNITNDVNGNGCHVDIHDLLFHGNYFYAFTDGGVARSSNKGSNWTKASSGLNIMQFTDIDVFNNTFVGGTQDNGTMKWGIGDVVGIHIKGGDGFECQIDRGAPDNVYVSTQNSRHYLFNTFPFTRTVTPPGHVNNWDASWSFHPTRSDTSYCCKRNIMRTYTGGLSWDSIGIDVFPNGLNIRAMSQGVSDPDIMYVSDRLQVGLTTSLHNANPIWENVSAGLGNYGDDPFWEPSIGSVSADPEHPYKVWVTTWGYESTGKVYYSSVYGRNGQWQDITGNLPNVPIRCSEPEPGPNDGIYVGTDIGVFYRNKNMSDWIWFGNNLPKVRIEDMAISDGYLYVGTFGRGAWRSPLYSTCIGALTLNATDMSGIHEFEALSQIISNRNVYGGEGTDVTFDAGLSVLLQDGFSVSAGSTFTAKIDGCQ